MKMQFWLLLASLVLFAAPRPCSALLSFGYVSTEEAKAQGLELSWKPSGAKAVRVELAFKTEGKWKAFSEPERANRIDLQVKGKEKSGPVVRAALREDRRIPGRISVSFTVERATLHQMELWIIQYLPGIADVMRMGDFIALDKIDPPGKAAAKAPEGGLGHASRAAVAAPDPDQPERGPPPAKPAATGGIVSTVEGASGKLPGMDLGAFSISLSVKDLQASRAFYEKFGFETVGGEAAQNWLILRNGDHTIGLFQGMFEKNTLTFNPGWDKNAQAVDGFTDIRELQRQLKAAGVELVTETDESGSAASLIAIDPDGNPILIDQHVSG